MKPSARIASQLTGTGGKPVVSLPTLGGTVRDLGPQPGDPVGGWVCFALGLAIILWSARRAARPGIGVKPHRSNFRAQPGDEVMLVELPQES